MTPERWQQIQTLLHAAMAVPPSDRGTYLTGACAGDDELLREVESLLAHLSQGSGFLSTPAVELGSAMPGRESSLVGRKLGRYTVEERLGSGGMGEVYRAEDTQLRRTVALKALHDDGVITVEGRQRLLREAQAVASLNHPNIAAIYDLIDVTGDDDTPPHIVMEYVPGETLSMRLRRGPLPVAEALRVCRDVADALAATHRQGIIHRDLKPANLQLTVDGRVKVLDFGLARRVAPSPADTTGLTTDRALLSRADQRIAGTPGYMSPEQALGRPVGTATDVFSLGIVMLEMLTGHRPYPVDDSLPAAPSRIDSPTPRVQDVRPEVSAAIDTLVTRMLFIEPGDRPSAADVVAEIDRLLRPDSTDVPAPVTPARPRWVQYAVGTAAVAIVLAGGAAWWRIAHPPDPNVRPVIAVLPLANLSGDESQAYQGVGIADALTTSLGRFAGVSIVSRATLDDAGALKMTDVAKIAASVGATMVVQGSVQQSGDRLHVAARLMTADGKIVWSGDTESAASDLLAAQTRLAGSLIDALQITVSSEERQRMARPPTENRAALDAYWQGLAQIDRAAQEPAYYDRAISNFERAISLDPQFSLAHAGLGNAYRNKSRVTNDRALMNQATAQVAEALRIDPNQPEVRLSLASVYRATGRNGAAVEELKRVLADQPANDDAHRILGDILAGEGRPEEALAELQRAVTLRPQYWRNQEILGLFYLRTGKMNEAIATLTRLTQLKPDDQSPYQQLGTAYQALGDKAHARQNYERSIALNPNSGSYTNLGTILYAEGKYEEAARAYEQAIRLSPKRALYRRNLADTYVRLKRPEDAQVAYEKAVQLAEEALTVNPSDATTISQLGVYEAKLGRRLDAERHADGAVALNPTSAEVLYRRAVVLALNGRPDEAFKQVSEAISRGYSKQFAREDDDLSSLRSLPAFQTLVAPAK
jgi:serine/threonine-protein kinase